MKLPIESSPETVKKGGGVVVVSGCGLDPNVACGQGKVPFWEIYPVRGCQANTQTMFSWHGHCKIDFCGDEAYDVI